MVERMREFVCACVRENVNDLFLDNKDTSCCKSLDGNKIRGKECVHMWLCVCDCKKRSAFN